MISSGRIDRAIAGGSDALSLFTIRGFDSLMIYDDTLCKPFDDTRKGLNLGEGAAYVMLESEDSMKFNNHEPVARLAGWANANDAYHATASSPEGVGAVKAMTEALQRAAISPDHVDYINAHGTATPNNDLTEATAIQQVFQNPPPFSSTKGLTGHTLAAAGALEAVFSIMAMEESTIWGNANFGTPMHDSALRPVLTNTPSRVTTVLSNSFGFGGNNSTLILTAE